MEEAEGMNIRTLQSKMKCDPDGYESTLLILYNQFNSLLHIFNDNTSFGIPTDHTFSQNLSDKAMFLAHLTPFYPNHLAQFPTQLIGLLGNKACNLTSFLRCNLARTLALLVNQRIVDLGETLSLFMTLQTLGDKTLKKLAFDHVVHSIRRINKQHKNHANNRALQNVLFDMLRQDKKHSQSDEKLAKRALVTLCELHRRKVWFDERTANAICTASFHSSSMIMIAALSFLLDYEKIENNDDSDDSSSDDELTKSPQVILSTATVYKANHQGTTASKKKKKAKLQRVIRSMKKQHLSSERGNNCYYSPLNHLKDAQGFAKKLFKCLKKCHERFEVRMMMMKLIARTVGLHQLILLKFYPFLQKYIQPHQRHITNILAMVVQACHDMVPPDVVEPLFKQIVNQFVHDSARPEAITIGLSAVREICTRMPLLMNEDLLQDLALYKKSRENAVSLASRSLIGLFRELCPSMLVKKDRGRPTDHKARPKAYGEVNVATVVPGVELLHIIDNDGELESDDSVCGGSDKDQMSIDSDDEENKVCINDTRGVDDYTEDIDVISEDEDEGSVDYEIDVSDDEVEDMKNDLEDSQEACEEDDEISEHEEDNDLHISSDDGTVEAKYALKKTAMKRKLAEFNGQLMTADSSLRALKKLAGTTMGHDLPEVEDMKNDLEDNQEACEEDDEISEHEEDNDLHISSDDGTVEAKYALKKTAMKRKFAEFNGQLMTADSSLRALKKLAGTTMGHDLPECKDGFLSNEDFQRIKELKAKREARKSLALHGLAKSEAIKVPNSSQLCLKRVDGTMLEVHIRKRLSKDEKLALVREGREERGKYHARTAVKQKKTGGLSNQQKENKKKIPMAVKRNKIARHKMQKKKKDQWSSKQFRGRKAWK